MEGFQLQVVFLHPSRPETTPAWWPVWNSNWPCWFWSAQLPQLALLLTVAEESQERNGGKTRVYVHREILQLARTVSGLAGSVQLPALKNFLAHVLLQLVPWQVSRVECASSERACKHTLVCGAVSFPDRYKGHAGPLLCSHSSPCFFSCVFWLLS